MTRRDRTGDAGKRRGEKVNGRKTVREGGSNHRKRSENQWGANNNRCRAQTQSVEGRERHTVTTRISGKKNKSGWGNHN